MKTFKMIYPLTVALATILVAAGCKHQPVAVTNLHNPPTPVPIATPPPTLQYNPGSDATGSGIAQASPDLFEGMRKDASIFASYTAHFKYDSAAVQKVDMDNLKTIAAKLNSDSSTKLLINGYCDERGTEEYNRALGERRALALREALAKIGLDPSRVRTVSYGKDNPVDPGHDEAAWAKNRRGEFILLLPQ